MTSITTEQFNKQLEEQKIMKWSELENNKIYTITNVEYMKTKYGEACIMILSDNKKIFAPSALINRLKQESNKRFPRYVRPKGKVPTNRNPAQTYYAFDLV